MVARVRPYPKPFLPVNDCVDLLRRRGMVIDDLPRARDCLRRIGYYRLSAYWYPFRQIVSADVAARRDEFVENTRFSEVMDFYIFDKKLRQHVSDVLERIEIAVRNAVIETLGSRSPYGHREPAHFNARVIRPEGDSPSRFDRFLSAQDVAFSRSSEEFAKHFRSHYTGPAPIWIAAGRWDWGNVAFIYRGLQEPLRREIAADFHPDLPANTLESWLGALNEVRNACAHHSRLWNKPLTNSPSFRGGFPEFTHVEGLGDPVARDQSAKRLYGALLAARFLLRQLQPESRWHRRLIDLIDAQTLPAAISETAAGFPAGWRGQPVWA